MIGTPMEPYFVQNGFLASLAAPSTTRSVVRTDAGDENTGGECFVDALAKESTGAVALVGDGDGDEEDKDEG